MPRPPTPTRRLLPLAALAVLLPRAAPAGAADLPVKGFAAGMATEITDPGGHAARQ